MKWNLYLFNHLIRDDLTKRINQKIIANTSKYNLKKSIKWSGNFIPTYKFDLFLDLNYFDCFLVIEEKKLIKNQLILLKILNL